VLTRAAQQRRIIEQKEREFRELILRACKAEPFTNDGFPMASTAAGWW